MKRVTIPFCIALFLFACTSQDNQTEVGKADESQVSTAADAKLKSDEWVPVDSATAMKSMMEAGTPGAQHAMLAKSAGQWVGETTMWQTPDGPAVKGTSTTINKMIMGGRFQQSTFKADFMGQPFEGSSTTGYDNTKKVFTITWIDNMSTAPMYMEGPWDEATKSINFKGKWICPANGKECEMRQVYKIIDDNTEVMEMYGPDMQTGKEYKNMEIKFTRKK